jgi:hypothetical protein
MKNLKLHMKIKAIHNILYHFLHILRVNIRYFCGILGVYFLIFPLYSESKNIKKIYFESLDVTPGVRPEIVTKIRNQVSLNILRYFKTKYTFIDDSVVQGLMNQLKKQQSLGCDTDKCYRMIEDNLSPDEKIAGIIQVEGNRYTLTLKLLDVSKGGGVVEQKEVYFSGTQLEYFVEEITRALLDTSYAINKENAPAEFIPGKLDLGSLKINSVEGVDIKIINFKTNDSNAEAIISELKEELQNGDSNFQKRNYSRALKSYENILLTIEKSLTADSRLKIKEYTDGIEKRIENSKTNIYAEKLKEIDERFKQSSGELSQKNIEGFIKEYDTLRTTILSSNQKSVIIASIDERTKKLELSLFGLWEREADSLYDIYQFSTAMERYESLKNKVNGSTRQSSSEIKPLVAKIEKKIKVTQDTGTSYYANQIRAYCNLAERENIKINLKRVKGEDYSTTNIKENIRKAEQIIRNNTLIDNDTLIYYNNVVRTLNKEGDRLGALLQKQDIGKKQSIEESNDFSIDFNLSGTKPFLFPGLGHLDKNTNSSRGTFYRNTGFVTLGLIGLSYLNYTQKSADYKSTDNLPFYLVSSSNGLITALIYSDLALKDSRTQYETSVNYVNGSIGLFGLLYVVSLIDYALTDDFKTSDGWKLKGMEYGKWDVKTERNVLQGMSGLGIDERVNLQYRMSW